jgi:hypothetical protein
MLEPDKRPDLGANKYYEVIPVNASFAAEAQTVISVCLPYWLISSSGHHRKNHTILFNEKKDNTIGHVLPGLKSYFDDCEAGICEWSQTTAMCFGLHDATEDYDDFADQEAINAGLAPNKYLLEQMQKDGISDYVLAVVMTSSKNSKAPADDKYYRDRNFLNSLSRPLTSPEIAAPEHFKVIARRFCEYGYITDQEIPEWEARFASSLEESDPAEAYLHIMSESRKVKLRDRYQSISEDLSLLREATRQGRTDISTIPYFEKTRALISKMYGNIDILDPQKRAQLIFAETIDSEELILFDRLKKLIHEASDFELINIFEKKLLDEDNFENIMHQDRLLRDHIYGGDQLSSYLQMTLVLKDYIESQFDKLSDGDHGIQTGTVFGNLIDHLQLYMPDIFTKERVNSNHFIYAISVIISQDAFKGGGCEWLESLEMAQNGNAEFFENREQLKSIAQADKLKPEDVQFIQKLKMRKLELIDLDKPYELMEKYDLEGSFISAFDCYYKALYSKDVVNVWECLHQLRGYYVPIFESLGFQDIAERFKDLCHKFSKQGSFNNPSQAIEKHQEFCEDTYKNIRSREQLIDMLSQSTDTRDFPDYSLIRTKRRILSRIVNGVLSPTDHKAIVHNMTQWQRLLNLGVGVNVIDESRNPLQAQLLRSN